MKKRACLLPLVLCLLASGCSRGGEETVISRYADGAKKDTGVFSGQKPNLAQIKGFEYYKSGERKKEFNFRDNHFFGPWTFWYKNGKKMAEGDIVVKTQDHQSAIGPATYFWPTGGKMIEITVDSKKTAAAISAVYDESGTRYTVQNKPPQLAQKIQTLLAQWEAGEI